MLLSQSRSTAGPKIWVPHFPSGSGPAHPRGYIGIMEEKIEATRDYIAVI